MIASPLAWAEPSPAQWAAVTAPTAPAPQPLVYARRGEADLVALAFPGAPNERRGTVVLLHGGGWVGGTTDSYVVYARFLAQQGLATFVVRYRLVRPEGPTMADAVMDGRTAVRWRRQQAPALGVDPHRIAVLGESAGGHLAATLAVLAEPNHPDDPPGVSCRPDALLLQNPVLDLTADDWPRTVVGGSALADKRSPRPSSPEALAVCRALSPLAHIAQGLPPTWIDHGATDRVVPLAQVEAFVAAHAAVGSVVEWNVLPDTGHAFGVVGYKSPEAVVRAAVGRVEAQLRRLGWMAPPATAAPDQNR